MDVNRTISIHPKMAGVIDAVFNVVILWLLTHINQGWVFLVWIFCRVFLWAGLVRLVFYPAGVSRFKHWLSLVAFFLGTVFFLIFIEWNWSWYLLAAVFVIFPLTSFWLLPDEGNQPTFSLKSLRHWLFIMTLFLVAGLWTAASAARILQIFNIGSWFWVLIASVLNTGVAVWWWTDYGLERNRRFWAWAAVWFLLMLELGWVIFLLPLGYLVNGLLLSWFWFLLWLLARYHLSKEGLIWQRQTFFYALNFILMLFFLVFIVRWK